MDALLSETYAVGAEEEMESDIALLHTRRRRDRNQNSESDLRSEPMSNGGPGHTAEGDKVLMKFLSGMNVWKVHFRTVRGWGA